MSFCWHEILETMFPLQAMKFDNTDASLYSNRSVCWLSLGVGDEALSDAQLCSKMRPDWAKGYYRQGMAFCLLQVIYDTWSMFIANRKHPLQFHLTRVLLYVCAKDYASASDVLLKASKLDPGNAAIAKALR